MSPAPKPAWGRAAAEIRACASRTGRLRLGACAIEGTRLFERALRAGASVRGVLVSEALMTEAPAREAAVLTALVDQGVEPQVIPATDFSELTGGRELGGMVGLAALPEPLAIQQLAASDGTALLLGAVGIDDPGLSLIHI